MNKRKGRANGPSDTSTRSLPLACEIETWWSACPCGCGMRVTWHRLSDGVVILDLRSGGAE